MTFEQLVQLLQIGWPALITVAFVFLARLYEARVDKLIAVLEARVVVLEKKLFDCVDERIKHDLTHGV